MHKVAKRALILLALIGPLTLGLLLFTIRFATNSGSWAVFNGSPHVYNGTNIGCGVVVDADNVLLLDMLKGRTYSDSQTLRKSTIHWLGDRLGYISAPAVAEYAEEMAGFDLVNGVYGYGENKGVARLTLSAKVQTAALEAMGDYHGTVAVYNYKTGQILCAVTTPNYDPDNVPEINDTDYRYEGIYVNRFTQSSYIPGSIFKVVTLAAALETIPDITEQTFVCTGSYTIGVDEITCEGAHWEQDLESAFRNSCNCAFAQIALQAGTDTMEQYVAQFGVTDSVTFDGITTQTGNYESGGTDVRLAWSGIGQYNDQVNPCAFLTYVGAIANGGKGVLPYLVDSVTVGDDTTYQAETKTGDRIMSEETALILQEFMRSNVVNRYGADNFGGLTVCAKTGTAEVGGDKKPNAMLVGFSTDPEYPLAFIVCAEDAGYGSTVCIPIASKVLEACKNHIDG